MRAIDIGGYRIESDGIRIMKIGTTREDISDGAKALIGALDIGIQDGSVHAEEGSPLRSKIEALRGLL